MTRCIYSVVAGEHRGRTPAIQSPLCCTTENVTRSITESLKISSGFLEDSLGKSEGHPTCGLAMIGATLSAKHL